MSAPTDVSRISLICSYLILSKYFMLKTIRCLSGNVNIAFWSFAVIICALAWLKFFPEVFSIYSPPKLMVFVLLMASLQDSVHYLLVALGFIS